MSVEPGVLDANVLVNVLDAGCAAGCFARVDSDCPRPATTLYLPIQGLCEFYSAVTNRR